MDEAVGEKKKEVKQGIVAFAASGCCTICKLS
jgi:hypothetical protein